MKTVKLKACLALLLSLALLLVFNCEDTPSNPPDMANEPKRAGQ